MPSPRATLRYARYRRYNTAISDTGDARAREDTGRAPRNFAENCRGLCSNGEFLGKELRNACLDSTLRLGGVEGERKGWRTVRRIGESRLKINMRVCIYIHFHT